MSQTAFLLYSVTAHSQACFQSTALTVAVVGVFRILKGGLPSKWKPELTLLSFRGQKRTDAFRVETGCMWRAQKGALVR